MTETEKIITVVFLAFWFYYAQRVGRSFLWMLWGKESIKITPLEVIYKRGIKNFGKAQQYFHENIRKMALQVPKENSIQQVWESSPWVMGGERIEFEYKGKMIRFGRKLNDKDAKLVFQMMTKRIEVFQRRLAKTN